MRAPEPDWPGDVDGHAPSRLGPVPVAGSTQLYVPASDVRAAFWLGVFGGATVLCAWQGEWLGAALGLNAAAVFWFALGRTRGISVDDREASERQGATPADGRRWNPGAHT